MKKMISLLLTATMLVTLAACASPSGNTAPASPTAQDTPTAQGSEQSPPSSAAPQSEAIDAGIVNSVNGKILVAYFSSAGNIATDQPAKGNVGKGNTKVVAELIEAQTGGDLFFIETENKYPSNYNDAIRVGMQELRDNARPALASHVDNMDDYDVIFLGYPIWWQNLPRAILTFIEEYDLSGKTIIPFCTHEDSGIGSSVKDLEAMLTDSTLKEAIVIAEHELGDAEEMVKEWLTELNLTQ